MLKHRIGRFSLHWILSAQASEWANIYNIPWCINSFFRSLFNPSSPLSFARSATRSLCRRSATLDFPFFCVFVRLLIPFSAKSQPWLVFTFFCAVSFHGLLVQEPSSWLLCTERFSSLLTSSTPCLGFAFRLNFSVHWFGPLSGHPHFHVSYAVQLITERLFSVNRKSG